MGKFKRYDGYVMHVPQEFIDTKLPVCPFCKSDNPHWLLDSRMEMSLAGSRTYYQCERCQATISSTAADAAAEKGKGFAINPAMAAMNAAQKGTKKQEVGVAYMRIDDLGSVCTDSSLLGQEFPITYLQDMAAPKKSFCTSCGTELSAGATFCSACGAKVVTVPAPEAAPAPVEAPAPEAAPAPAAEPVVVLEAPAPGAEPAAPIASGWKPPIASIILAGVAALYTFIMMCMRGGFFNDFMSLNAIAAVIVGMIICKKEKNLITAIGFFVLAFMELINCFSALTYGPGIYRFFAFMFISVIWIAKGGIGVTYLLGKEKLANLKTLACTLVAAISFFMAVISSITFRGGFGGRFLGFLFCTVPLCMAAVLYTPFKKN